MPLKFLVIQTAFIGDVVLATSLVENLREGFPDARIDFLLRKGNESLFHQHPFIAKVLVWNKQHKKIPDLLRLLLTIRKENYDKVINVQRYAATGLLTAFSGAAQTIGFDKNPFSFLFTIKIKHESEGEVSPLHETQKNHRLIRHFIDRDVCRPRLYPSPGDQASVESYAGHPFITISPGSVWFTKQYPPQKWAEFIRSQIGKYRVYLLGASNDRSLAEAIIQMTPEGAPVNLCGELSFLQSAALMKHATMNFVNDSAPMHFASAVNAPVTVVYCSTIPAFGYGPLSDTRFIVQRTDPLYCRPCGIHGYSACPQGHFKCALDIATQQLLTITDD